MYGRVSISGCGYTVNWSSHPSWAAVLVAKGWMFWQRMSSLLFFEELRLLGPKPCRQESVKKEMCISTEQENQLRKEMCIGKYLFACKIM